MLVTLAFAVAISLVSVTVVNMVEDDLVDSTRASAESVLTTYLDSIYGGVATVGIVDSTEGTRFFYLDADGVEISEQQYFDTISRGLDRELAALIESGGVAPNEVVTAGVLSAAVGEAPFVGVEVRPDTGVLVDPTGTAITFIHGPLPVGEPHRVDLGDDVVGIAQALAFDGGTTFEVGVSSPLQPVTDSLDTIRAVLWVGVPILVAAIASITWLAASRALGPVHAISSRARAITATSIDERVPVPDVDDEIRELATTVNDMLARLERSHSRQRQLVADASHELRSPVAASRAQLEVARDNPDSTDWVATATKVLAEQERLGHLVDDLLASSRMDETGARGDDDVDLDDVIAIEACRTHPVTVRTSVPEPVRITGDLGLLTRAVRNLVDNATRHAANDVLVALGRSDGSAVITVDDDGPGIPVEQRERVFDRFTRVDEARDRKAGGAGLGLAIAREVARAHDGDLVATDSPLGGARLTLTIPADRG